MHPVMTKKDLKAVGFTDYQASEIIRRIKTQLKAELPLYANPRIGFVPAMEVACFLFGVASQRSGGSGRRIPAASDRFAGAGGGTPFSGHGPTGDSGSTEKYGEKRLRFLSECPALEGAKGSGGSNLIQKFKGGRLNA